MRITTLAPALTLTLLAAPLHAAQSDAEGLDLFEKKIRPVLVEHCQACHSAEARQAGKLRGGLLLDSRAGLLRGGDSGPAVEPGKPGESLLVKVLRYTGAIRMPPRGKLPEGVADSFERWIALGAPDPREGGTATQAGIDLAAGRRHWAFQPPRAAEPPRVGNAAWPRGPIDTFVLAEMEGHGLEPVAEADRRTLIRRLYFDLVGLPPTPAEVEAFVEDQRPEAYAELVERLLRSPRHGERWARHWLDVARYAEDQAHTFGVRKKTSAYQYRDWVIAALNADMPYDRFVRLQLAGDLMKPGEKDLFTQLAGLGFLGLGAEYYKNSAKEQAIADELDDRIDTLTRGFLGLTVSCARCHDHKFDPIPQRDYYSLAGIFYGSQLADAPLAGPEEVARYQKGQQEVKEQDDRIRAWLSERGQARGREEFPHVARYLLAAWRVRVLRHFKVSHSLDAVAGAEGIHPYFLARWVKYLEPGNAGKVIPALREWHDLPVPAQAPAGAEGVAIPAQLRRLADRLQEEVRAAEKEYLRVEAEHARATAKLPGEEKKKAKKPALPKEAEQLLRGVWLDEAAPLAAAPNDVAKLFLDGAEKADLERMRAELDRRKADAPAMYPVAHVLRGGGKDLEVYVRGNPAQRGEKAPRGFLQVLGPQGSEPGPDYGRLELADAVAAPDNPLTARVIVNRVWQQYFGRGIVSTASNFGKLGEPPSHPELLDWLAVRFVENGWSLRWLHREIVLSSTYRLGSASHAGNAEKDAANVYLWRHGRKRLDVEAWRDALLAVSGQLDPAMGGPTFELDGNARRRTVYARISRHELNGLLRLFDFPDANVTAARRTETTVPQQQLFALNGELVIGQARALAARLAKMADGDAGRVDAAYRLLYGRPAREREVALALAFLSAPVEEKEEKLTRWEQLAQALLAANEFLYID